MRLLLLASTVLIGLCSLSNSAAAIGFCEELTARSTLVGVSTKLRQVAVVRTEETCTETDEFGEERKVTTELWLYDHRAKLVKKFRLASERDAKKHPYVVGNKFVKISSAPVSPNKRCRVSGVDSRDSKHLTVRRRTRRLFSKRIRKEGVRIEVRPYWFVAGKLLVLHQEETINPGHYAEHSTSSIQLIAAGQHRMGACFR